MKKHSQIYEKVPEELFQNALSEVLKIDWNNVKPGARTKFVFATSLTEHLRVHATNPDTPLTLEALSAIVECRDTAVREKYVEVEKLITWVKNTVKCTREGRIMIINLLPNGSVHEHADPGLYFQNYYRFHVPLVTSPGCMFYGPNKSDPVHMPEGYLCQLDNRNLHSVENNSSVSRIHLLIDLDSDEPQYK